MHARLESSLYFLECPPSSIYLQLIDNLSTMGMGDTVLYLGALLLPKIQGRFTNGEIKNGY